MIFRYRIQWPIAGLLILGQISAVACVDPSRVDERPVPRIQPPLAEPGAQPTPLEQRMPVGAVYAYLAPEGTVASVRVIRQGMSLPLEVLNRETVERLGYPAAGGAFEQRWIYVHAASYGKAELRLNTPSGKTYAVVIGMIYPHEEPVGEPLRLEVAGSGGEPSFAVDANNNTLWLSLPGQVGDGWRMTSGDETSFSLIRVEQLAMPYGDGPRVGLFLEAGRSVSSGVIELQSVPAGLFAARKTYRFKVNARPVPAC
ncbi:hypothetical protein [Cupriavidus basilensis]|uniref:hypothetical protein n=1 Tax=Cupriavidus basilensis TaxID=68895 RepID=UPI0039F6D8B6